MTRIEPPAGFGGNVTYDAVRARATRRCESYPSRPDEIKPGDVYLLCTEYPGGESGYATSAGHPVRLHICLTCAPQWFREAVRETKGSGSGPT